MKITIFCLHLGFGGVENYVCNLANMLVDKHDVNIVSTYKLMEPAFYLDDKVKVSYLCDAVPNRKELKDAISRKRPLQVLKEGMKAIKILHDKRKLNIKAIKACDSDVIISTRIFHNNLISKYAKNVKVKLTGEHNYHNDDRSYIDKVLKSCHGFDYFLPISKTLADFYAPMMNEIGVKTRFIPFGFKFSKRELAKNDVDRQKNLISVGRLSKEKGFDDLLKVFYRIKQLDGTFILNIVGDGPMLQDLKSLVKELGIEDSVVFHGFLKQEQIKPIMEKSFAYVMTSHTESLGLVLLEAINSECIPFAFDSAKGALEIIDDRENGFLIENRDFDKMAQVIVSLSKDKKQQEKMILNGNLIIDRYSYENVKSKWNELMDDIEKDI